jgi:hypothetical protein
MYRYRVSKYSLYRYLRILPKLGGLLMKRRTPLELDSRLFELETLDLGSRMKELRTRMKLDYRLIEQRTGLDLRCRMIGLRTRLKLGSGLTELRT